MTDRASDDPQPLPKQRGQKGDRRKGSLGANMRQDDAPQVGNTAPVQVPPAQSQPDASSLNSRAHQHSPSKGTMPMPQGLVLVAVVFQVPDDEAIVARGQPMVATDWLEDLLRRTHSSFKAAHGEIARAAKVSPHALKTVTGIADGTMKLAIVTRPDRIPPSNMKKLGLAATSIAKAVHAAFQDAGAYSAAQIQAEEADQIKGSAADRDKDSQLNVAESKVDPESELTVMFGDASFVDRIRPGLAQKLTSAKNPVALEISIVANGEPLRAGYLTLPPNEPQAVEPLRLSHEVIQMEVSVTDFNSNGTCTLRTPERKSQMIAKFQTHSQLTAQLRLALHYPPIVVEVQWYEYDEHLLAKRPVDLEIVKIVGVTESWRGPSGAYESLNATLKEFATIMSEQEKSKK